ncbi:MAG TPA: thioesterase, partial [Erythrobacter sp.]|nr:thioesterase [Erythrobacter sp.]
NTVIRRGEDVLAEVQSMWCCIDAKSLRPARISREVAETCFGLPGKPKVQTGS